MSDHEQLAVLVAVYDDDGVEHPTVVVRDFSGNVSVEELPLDDTGVRRAMRALQLRRGRPIIDPESREVMGYELERVVTHH